MSLYKKYRPKTFKQVRGNSEAVQSLKKFLSEPDKMPHSYLFHGDTGCGKTTLGRLVKKELEVSDADYMEINSSDKRGVDDIREVIKNCRFKPLESSHRIYLIDECHKLTNDAQNAFLKILEDTPEHVVFILCTTEKNKLIKAIQNRCQDFHLKPLNDKDMFSLLNWIVKREREVIEEKVGAQIIESADGHPRNAIQILEQVLSVEPEKRLEVSTRKEAERNEAIDLCRALLRKGVNWKEIAGILKGIKENGTEGEAVRRVVIGYAASVLLNKSEPKCGVILEEFIEPFYNSGFPGLVYACYNVINS